MSDLQYFIDHGAGKKIYLDEVCPRDFYLLLFLTSEFIIEWMAIN